MVSYQKALEQVVAYIFFKQQVESSFTPAPVDPIWSTFKAHRCNKCGEYRNWEYGDICRVCTAPPPFHAPPRPRRQNQTRRRQYQDDFYEFKNYTYF